MTANGEKRDKEVADGDDGDDGDDENEIASIENDDDLVEEDANLNDDDQMVIDSIDHTQLKIIEENDNDNEAAYELKSEVHGTGMDIPLIVAKKEIFYDPEVTTRDRITKDEEVKEKSKWKIWGLMTDYIDTRANLIIWTP